VSASGPKRSSKQIEKNHNALDSKTPARTGSYFGFNPLEAVAINFQSLLRHYIEVGAQRTSVGERVDVWDKSAAVARPTNFCLAILPLFLFTGRDKS
jgi:hypothetical protein